MAKNIQIITIGGNCFLGTLVKNEDGSVVITDGLSIGAEATQTDLANYLKAQNNNTLEKNIEVNGLVAVSVRDLSDALAFKYDILNLQMGLAKKQAVVGLENTEFDKIVRG